MAALGRLLSHSAPQLSPCKKGLINTYLIVVLKTVSDQTVDAGHDINVSCLHHQPEHKAHTSHTQKQAMKGDFLQAYHQTLSFLSNTGTSN